MATRLRQDGFSPDTVQSFAADAVTDSAGGAGSDRSFAVHLGPVEHAVRSFRRSPSEQTRFRLDAALASFKEVRRSRALARWRGIEIAHLAARASEQESDHAA